MSIEQLDVVDAVGTDRAKGKVVLLLSDHLDWSSELEHLDLLQAKLNTYLRFVESGEIYDAYPAAKTCSIAIHLVMQHSPTSRGRQFLSYADSMIRGSGIGFETAYPDP